MNARRRGLVALGLALALAAVPAAARLEPSRRVVTDMVGREVTVPAAPRRIVCLVPSAAEVVYALGADDRLAGVTDYCDFPPAARQKPSVGGMVAPSLEAVVALRPDLVLGTSEGTREEALNQLRRLGIPSYLVVAHRLLDVTDLVARIAELTERQPEGAALLARMNARLAAVRRAVAPLPRPRVLYVLWPEPLIVPGRSALITELIDLAGGQSVTAQDGEAYPRYSLEAAVARAPEVIILADHGGTRNGPVAPEKWRRLESLPALKTGRVHSIDGNLLHRYGPRVVDGVEQLARLIHPDAFR